MSTDPIFHFETDETDFFTGGLRFGGHPSVASTVLEPRTYQGYGFAVGREGRAFLTVHEDGTVTTAWAVVTHTCPECSKPVELLSMDYRGRWATCWWHDDDEGTPACGRTPWHESPPRGALGGVIEHVTPETETMVY